MGLVSLAGCSAASTAYRFADWWIEYRIETWVDLDGKQETALQAKLGDFLTWHRAVVIPQIVTLTDELTQAATRGEIMQVVRNREALIDELFHESVRPVAVAVGEVFVTLESDQIDELEEGLAGQLEDARERMRDPSRQGKMADRMKGWLGELTDEQRLILRTVSKPSDQSLRFQCRVMRQQQLVEALRAGKSAEVVGSIMTRWWTVRGCGEAMDRQREAAREMWQDAMGRLESSLNENQRASLAKELGDLGSEVRQMLAD